MHRVTLCALAVWGTLAVAACDEPGNAPASRLLAATAASPEVRQSLSLPVHATATAQLSGCNTGQGVSVALNGQLALPSLGARLTFYNNEKGTHDAVVEAQGQASVVPAGATLTIPSQSTQSGVSGQPSVSLQLESGGRPLTSEVALGTCGGSLVSLSGDFTLPATARATVTSCQNNAGAAVALSGALTIEAAVDARVTLRRDTTSASSSATSGTLQILVVPDQGTVQFAKQPVKGGAGGNPWIYLQFLDATGTPVGQEFLIGRCAQLT
jgi:hypothetical protein